MQTETLSLKETMLLDFIMTAHECGDLEALVPNLSVEDRKECLAVLKKHLDLEDHIPLDERIRFAA